MSINSLEVLINKHDLTYENSDSHDKWQRGERTLAAIETVAANFPREEVVKLWNSVVDKKIKDPEIAKGFYWN